MVLGLLTITEHDVLLGFVYFKFLVLFTYLERKRILDLRQMCLRWHMTSLYSLLLKFAALILFFHVIRKVVTSSKFLHYLFVTKRLRFLLEEGLN